MRLGLGHGLWVNHGGVTVRAMWCRACLTTCSIMPRYGSLVEEAGSLVARSVSASNW